MTRIMALLSPEPEHQTVHANFHLLEAEYDLTSTLLQSPYLGVSLSYSFLNKDAKERNCLPHRYEAPDAISGVCKFCILNPET